MMLDEVCAAVEPGGLVSSTTLSTMLNLSQSEGMNRHLTGVIKSRPAPKQMMTGGSLADLSMQPPDLNTVVVFGSNAVHARIS
jgi:hypothetical protein